LLFFILVSCEDQVKFNNPAVQGLKNNVVWRATLITATQNTDGSLKIEAYYGNEVVRLTTISTTVDTYVLGENILNKADYEQNNTNGKLIFTTGVQSGEGEIEITEFDAINKTITGEFKFTANKVTSNSTDVESVSFQKGIFYKVPITLATK